MLEGQKSITRSRTARQLADVIPKGLAGASKRDLTNCVWSQWRTEDLNHYVRHILTRKCHTRCKPT